MRPIKIMTDTCADLPKGYIEENNLGVINFTIFLNGNEIYVDPNWKTISSTNLYNTLRDGTRIWTLPATMDEIRTKMSEVLDEGYDIIFIGTSEKQSTTVDKARRVAKTLNKNYPDARIAILDSRNASVGISLCVMHAVECLKENKDFDTIVEEVKFMRKRVIQFVTTETLTYLSKANKINARSASLGNLIGIKPILVSDANGNQTAMSKVKGREKSMNEIVRLYLENVVEPENQITYIVHGDDMDAAKAVKAKLLSSGTKFKDIEIICVGAVVGITTGPGMVGIFGIGKEVTYTGE